MAFWPGFRRPGRSKASPEAEVRHNRLIDDSVVSSLCFLSIFHMPDAGDPEQRRSCTPETPTLWQ